ncbi:hypothetical protein B0H10DRAFT_1956516 [Mycena sp. CBHHK59/15]|nr:hypothetical protein B0H10DRAFT_1956516 [Mycena sp. CBHHK59/15]
MCSEGSRSGKYDAWFGSRGFQNYWGGDGPRPPLESSTRNTIFPFPHRFYMVDVPGTSAAIRQIFAMRQFMGSEIHRTKKKSMPTQSLTHGALNGLPGNPVEYGRRGENYNAMMRPSAWASSAKLALPVLSFHSVALNYPVSTHGFGAAIRRLRPDFASVSWKTPLVAITFLLHRGNASVVGSISHAVPSPVSLYWLFRCDSYNQVMLTSMPPESTRTTAPQADVLQSGTHVESHRLIGRPPTCVRSNSRSTHIVAQRVAIELIYLWSWTVFHGLNAVMRIPSRSAYHASPLLLLGLVLTHSASLSSTALPTCASTQDDGEPVAFWISYYNVHLVGRASSLWHKTIDLFVGINSPPASTWADSSQIAKETIESRVRAYNQYLARQGTTDHVPSLVDLAAEHLGDAIDEIPLPIMERALSRLFRENDNPRPWVLRNEKWLREAGDTHWEHGLVTLNDADAVFESSVLTKSARTITRPEHLPGYEVLCEARESQIDIQPSLEAFKRTFEYMSDGLLKNLDWTNLMVAGGIVLGAH